ncbi:MAG: Tripartite ATP-independent periplasmic transporter DctQ component [Fibrobacteres bacterium]|nr:Tripartite ATP-independent periplasmic transporter DctQ component [Fibrobacterota bacterium]
MTGFLRRMDNGLAKAEEVFLALALGTMILVVFADFVLRETLNQGLIWAKELAVYLLVWVGFLGASLAVHRRRHLVVQAGEKWFPERVRKWTSLAACLTTAVLCLILAWLGARFVLETRTIGETSLGMGVPMWIVQIVIPLAFLIIGLRFLGLCGAILRHGPISLGSDEIPIPDSVLDRT